MTETNKAAIDSCSIFLPLHLLDSYNTELDNSQALMTLETGEIDVSSIKQKADITIHSNGYNTYYKRKLSNRGYKHATDGIAISITSKHLRERYSEGITNNTIETLHANLMLEGQIEITLDNFKQGMLSDVDIKLDFKLPDCYSTFTELTTALYAAANKTIFGELPLVKHYKSKTNQGINFGSRSMSNVIPHFKIYNKLVELEYHSNDFKQAYDPPITHPVRLEVNLKNNAMLKKYKLIEPDEQPHLATIINHLGNFSMKPIMNLYVTGMVKKQDHSALDKAIKQKKIELQSLNVARILLDKTSMSVSEIVDQTITALAPTKNDIKPIRTMLTDVLNEEIDNANPISLVDQLFAFN